MWITQFLQEQKSSFTHLLSALRGVSLLWYVSGSQLYVRMVLLEILFSVAVTIAQQKTTA